MADQAINALSTKTAPETSDQLLLVGAGEPQLIDYDKLADAILNKITSKNYALDAGTMTLPAALNALNGKSLKSVIMSISGIKIKNSDPGFEYYSDPIEANIPEGTTIVAVILCGGFSAGVVVSSTNKNDFTLSCNNSVVLPANRSARIWYI